MNSLIQSYMEQLRTGAFFNVTDLLALRYLQIKEWAMIEDAYANWCKQVGIECVDEPLWEPLLPECEETE